MNSNPLTQTKKKHVIIFTDGACRGNPGPGGWGAVLRYNEHMKTLSGAEINTTNNRMELIAVIKALAELKEPCFVELTTDSLYVKNGITEYLPRWKRNNWLTTSKQPVKNLDLWLELESLTEKNDIHWHWVKGHSGHLENELVDTLANEALDNMLKGEDDK